MVRAPNQYLRGHRSQSFQELRLFLCPKLMTNGHFNLEHLSTKLKIYHISLFIDRAAMGQAWFLLCMGFIFRCFCIFLSVTRPKHPLGQISLNHATGVVYKCIINVHKCTDKLRILFSISCIKYFFFWLIEALDSKGILNTLKKVLRQPWNVLTLQLSLSLSLRPLCHHKFQNRFERWCNIGLCDSCDYFASPLLILQTD